ncbi:inositol monophosphatase family protein [Candidatus Saccharibacteria bacterium]|nr:inositol monophosphatase family protein [Candidatus Saccharibacteria bacterium]
MSIPNSDFVRALLRTFRKEIMSVYGKADYEFKGDASVVTEIDRSIEKKLIGALSSEYPDIGFYGEEYGRQGSTDKYWLIDPIDGTENYIRGLPGVTTLLALVEQGEVTQSYVYDIAEDIVYWALKNKGAFRNEKKIELKMRTIDRTIITVSSGVPVKFPNLAKRLSEAGIMYTEVGYGGGGRLTNIASGKIDGVVTSHAGGGQWDFAPVVFIAREAGFVVTHFDRDDIDSREFCFLSPSTNKVLLPIIKEQIQHED